MTSVIDLDLVWVMVQRTAPELPIDGWPLARRGVALLTNTFLDSGMEIVIIEGPFGTERDSLHRFLAADLDPQFVTLRVSFDEAWRRVERDPTSPDFARPRISRPHARRVAAPVSPARADRTDLGYRELDAERTGPTVVRLGACMSLSWITVQPHRLPSERPSRRQRGGVVAAGHPSRLPRGEEASFTCSAPPAS